MTFEMIKRQAIIVWVYSIKSAKPIRKLGLAHYTSHKMRYIVLYVNQDKVEETVKILEKYPFVKKIEVSYRDTIDMTFKDAIPDRIDPDLKVQQEATPEGDVFLKNLVQSLNQSQ